MNEQETKMAKSGEDQHEFRTTNLKNINNNNDYVGQIRLTFPIGLTPSLISLSVVPIPQDTFTYLQGSSRLVQFLSLFLTL